MSFININWYITLAFCLIFFIGGRQLAEVPGTTQQSRRAVRLLLFVFALPSLLFPLPNFVKSIAAMPWYNTFRSLNRIELLAALVAPLAGYMTYQNTDPQYRRYGAAYASTAARAIKPYALPFCVLLISACFVRPFFKPINKTVTFYDNWTDTGIFLTSINSGSGPASLMSAMYSLNRFVDDEYEAVKGTYTDNAGTDFWYLARYAANRGYRVKFMKAVDVADMPVPSVVRVLTPAAESRLSAFLPSKLKPKFFKESYVTLLNRFSDGRLLIGDPMHGKSEIEAGDFAALYSEPDIILSVSMPKSK